MEKLIQVGNPLKLSSDTGVRVLSREPFAAEWAADGDGVLRRTPPVSIDLPFGPMPVAGYLAKYAPIELPEFFVIEVTDAFVAGPRAIVTRGDQFLITDSVHPSHAPSIFVQDERLRFEDVHLTHKDGAFELSRDALPAVPIKGETCLLTAMEHDNYGAFLLRAIPKIVSLRKLGIPIKKAIAPSASPWQKAVYGEIGVDLAALIDHERSKTYRVDRLIVPSMRTSEFFLDDDTREMFQSLAEKLSAGEAQTNKPEKLYVSRQNQGYWKPNYRFFVNENELIHRLKLQGFLIFEPEKHSFAEQVRAFRSAKLVVGPGGAGMFNTVFCRPGTKVISIESQPDWVASHANIFSSNKLEYALILGGADQSDPTPQKRWNADVGCVMSRINAFGH